MTEKTQKEDIARSGAEPEPAAAEEPAEIKACVGATGGEEGTITPAAGRKGDGSAILRKSLSGSGPTSSPRSRPCSTPRFLSTSMNSA
jgi:hypothetical protein